MGTPDSWVFELQLKIAPSSWTLNSNYNVYHWLSWFSDHWVWAETILPMFLVIQLAELILKLLDFCNCTSESLIINLFIYMTYIYVYIYWSDIGMLLILFLWWALINIGGVISLLLLRKKKTYYKEIDCYCLLDRQRHTCMNWGRDLESLQRHIKSTCWEFTGLGSRLWQNKNRPGLISFLFYYWTTTMGYSEICLTPSSEADRQVHTHIYNQNSKFNLAQVHQYTIGIITLHWASFLVLVTNSDWSRTQKQGYNY
jgi:hypothetical protein